LGEVLEPKCQRDAHLITYVKPITLLGWMVLILLYRKERLPVQCVSVIKETVVIIQKESRLLIVARIMSINLVLRRNVPHDTVVHTILQRVCCYCTITLLLHIEVYSQCKVSYSVTIRLFLIFLVHELLMNLISYLALHHSAKILKQKHKRNTMDS
jgi:hypothetical protein